MWILLSLFFFFLPIYHSQTTKVFFYFWVDFFKKPPCDLLNPAVQTRAASLHQGHFSPRITHVPSAFSQIDARMLKFTKHLVSDMKNTRIWSSCFHLQKQSRRKTGGLSFNQCCWLAKWRRESKKAAHCYTDSKNKIISTLSEPSS